MLNYNFKNRNPNEYPANSWLAMMVVREIICARKTLGPRGLHNKLTSASFCRLVVFRTARTGWATHDARHHPIKMAKLIFWEPRGQQPPEDAPFHSGGFGIME